MAKLGCGLLFLTQARAALQSRVTPEKRDAVMKEIAAEARKTLDESAPIVRAAAQKVAPATAGALLQQRFSDEELRQIIALLESPVRLKFEQALPELRRAIGEAVAKETRAQVDPKLKAMSQSIGEKMRQASLNP